MLILLFLFCGYRFRRHWTGRILLIIAIVAGIVGFRLAQPPLKTHTPVHCVLSLPGTEIFVGKDLLGRGGLSLSITGKEKYCVPLDDSADVHEQIRQLLPDATLLKVASGPLHESEGVSFTSANCLVRRSDGTLDSFIILTYSTDDGGNRFATILRFRRKDECGISTFEMPVSRVIQFRDLMEQVVNRERTVTAVLRPEITLTSGAEVLAEHGATSWWLAGFPAGISDLSESK